jgi:hypothetical protein
MVGGVAWAVSPGGSGRTRAEKLVAELVALGVIDPDFVPYFHGRTPPANGAVSVGVLMPNRRLRRVLPSERSLAVVSPVFSRAIEGRRFWTDLYDDWALAPDINRLHRTLSRNTYRGIRAHPGMYGVVTCNSDYMRQKLQLGPKSLVPNGVDPALAEFPRTGDERRRLVILGHFFRGRTDFGLIEQVVEAGQFDEIVVGAPGQSSEMARTLRRLATGRAKLTVHTWLSPLDLSSTIGSRTVALVPHVVNDYTLSQDLMKVYQFLALGLRPIVPRLLWPKHLAPDNSLLLDFGLSLERVLRQWIDTEPPADEWRTAFASRHSWAVRAMQVKRLLGAGAD